jgi:hypothetical protein
VDANGEEKAISGAEVSVSAFESTQRRATELVHVPLRAIGSDIQVIEENAVINLSSPRHLQGKMENQTLLASHFRSNGRDYSLEKPRQILSATKVTTNLHILTSVINPGGGRRGMQQQFYIRISLVVILQLLSQQLNLAQLS